MNTTVSDYREFLPPARLESHLICFWTQTIKDSTGTLPGAREPFQQRVSVTSTVASI